LINMSSLGNCGSRFNRAATACIALLPSERPFSQTSRLSSTTGCRPCQVMLLPMPAASRHASVSSPARVVQDTPAPLKRIVRTRVRGADNLNLDQPGGCLSWVIDGRPLGFHGIDDLVSCWRRTANGAIELSTICIHKSTRNRRLLTPQSVSLRLEVASSHATT